MMTGPMAVSERWLTNLWAAAGLFFFFLGVACNGAPAVKGIYVGNDFYAPSDAAINAARSGGFTRVFLSYLRVDEKGDLAYNRITVVQNGTYVGDSTWGMKLESLKRPPSGIDRIEIVIGGQGDASLSHVAALLGKESNLTNGVLFRNLRSLKSATGIDAIQIDDYELRDASTAVAFGNLASQLGMKVTFFSTRGREQSASAMAELGEKADAVYVPCYEADDSPKWWVPASGNRRVYPGVWGNNDTPSAATTRLRAWRNTLGIAGGFVWLNGYMPVDAPKWAEALRLGLDPMPSFRIANRNSGKSLDLAGGSQQNGTPINQSRYSTNENQNWLLVPTETGEHFKIVSATSGKCASIALDSTSDGAQLWAWEYAGGDPSQQFDLAYAGNGWVKIKNVRSEKVLEVAGGSVVDGAKVQQYTDNGTPAQQWALLPLQTDERAPFLSEDFDYPADEALAGRTGGTGWNGAWLDEPASAARVSGESLLTGREGLTISNLAAGLRSAYVVQHQRVGRYVDCSAGGIFGLHGYLDAKGRVGADGTTLFISFLQRPRSTDLFYEFELNRGTERIAGIGNDTRTANVNLRAPATTFTPIGPGSTELNLYVVRIDFKPGNDDIRVYRNPGTDREPDESSLTLAGVADLSFDRVSVAAFVNSNAVWHSRIRMAPAWQDLFRKPETGKTRSLADITPKDLFWKVKVHGQVALGSGQMYYLVGDTEVAQVYLKKSMPFDPGDVVEVSGLVHRAGSAVVLINAEARKTRHAVLPQPRPLNVLNPERDLSRGSIEGMLLGVKQSGTEALLEVEAGYTRLAARLPSRDPSVLNIEPGSRLKLTGILVQPGKEHRGADGSSSRGIELLLQSPNDIQLLALPPWWTLKRLAVALAIMAAGLVVTFLWITLLRRQVDLRTQQLQREISQRKRVEQERAIEEERSRISRDLHDELGSKLTQISMLATTGPSMKMTLESAADRLRVVAEKSRSMIVALDGVVWAVNPKNNTLYSLGSYLAAYTEEFLGRTGITCRVDAPSSYPERPIPAEVRNNVLLAVKEAINNAVRHAQPTRITLKLSVSGALFQIEIQDNGCGFNAGRLSQGNGLLNLHQRMKELGGGCEIVSHIGKGTTVRLSVPLNG